MLLLIIGIFLPAFWSLKSGVGQSETRVLMIFGLWFSMMFWPNGFIRGSFLHILYSSLVALATVPIVIFFAEVMFERFMHSRFDTFFILLSLTPTIMTLLLLEMIYNNCVDVLRLFFGTSVLFFLLCFLDALTRDIDGISGVAGPNYKLLMIYPIVMWIAIPFILGRTVTGDMRNTSRHDDKVSGVIKANVRWDWLHYFYPVVVMALISYCAMLPIIIAGARLRSWPSDAASWFVASQWLLLCFLPNSILRRRGSYLFISSIVGLLSIPVVATFGVVCFSNFRHTPFPELAPLFVFAPAMMLLLLCEMTCFEHGSFLRLIAGTATLMVLLYFVAHIVSRIDHSELFAPSFKLVMIYPIVVWLAIPWILGRTATGSGDKKLDQGRAA